jgi:hypothetical protein
MACWIQAAAKMLRLCCAHADQRGRIALPFQDLDDK